MNIFLSVNRHLVISNGLLVLLVLFPILPFAFSSIISVIFVLSVIVLNHGELTANFSSNKKSFLVHILFYLCMIFSIVYTDNLSKGLEEVKRGLPLLLFPFVFYFNKCLFKKWFLSVLKAFVFANFIYIIYLYNFIVDKLSPYKDFGFRHEIYPIKFVKSFTISFNQILQKAIHVQYKPPYLMFHKAYLSMFVLFSIFILIFLVSRTEKRFAKVLYILIALFFCFVLFHWFSMPNIAVLLIALLFLIIKRLRKFKLRLIFLLFIIVSSFFLANNSFVKSKIESNILINLNYKQVSNFFKNSLNNNTLNISGRAAINNCSLILIKEHPFFGYGIGSVSNKLLECYKENNYLNEYNNKLNSHNNFTHIYLSSGIIAFLSILYFFFYFFKFSIKNKDYLYLSFLAIVLVNMLFETILYRSHGILFFSIFSPLLYVNSQKS
ncbi:O-antigen ligase [Mesoflavibacter sabulilitoris]|uniref:O-antigen ligase-related domain-containing protein n=2 Tax=Mesoflavibacter TaxID=444051 RepID=A0A2T1N6H3_9FLAO|nr:O-antigen ligase [Mesoflavibacter zeaxanthinifaciens subsp. sabulilitoris]PSG87188.1 hypothetical protein C7H61_13860 [Mesoflavibacter zeaxanthinifaciens subsp. sabulilitoris]